MNTPENQSNHPQPEEGSDHGQPQAEAGLADEAKARVMADGSKLRRDAAAEARVRAASMEGSLNPLKRLAHSRALRRSQQNDESAERVEMQRGELVDGYRLMKSSPEAQNFLREAESRARSTEHTEVADNLRDIITSSAEELAGRGSGFDIPALGGVLLAIAARMPESADPAPHYISLAEEGLEPDKVARRALHLIGMDDDKDIQQCLWELKAHQDFRVAVSDVVLEFEQRRAHEVDPYATILGEKHKYSQFLGVRIRKGKLDNESKPPN